MVFVGTTRSGTAVRFNRRVMDARNLIVIGTVEPHYFAGFTGGRKSFLPGCAAYETVESNHRFALDRGFHDLRPGGQSGSRGHAIGRGDARRINPFSPSRPCSTGTTGSSRRSRGNWSPRSAWPSEASRESLLRSGPGAGRTSWSVRSPRRSTRTSTRRTRRSKTPNRP